MTVNVTLVMKETEKLAMTSMSVNRQILAQLMQTV